MRPLGQGVALVHSWATAGLRPGHAGLRPLRGCPRRALCIMTGIHTNSEILIFRYNCNYIP